MPALILVNKENPLDFNYVPSNLVLVNNPFFKSLNKEIKLQVIDYVYEAFLKMAQDAQKLGYEIYIDSGYRSGLYQQEILNHYLNELGKEAYNKVALPGTSEHQTGLAIDIGTLIDGIYYEEITEDMRVFKWLNDNAYKYGFILRYPKGKEAITGYKFEPWHFRFVGQTLAYHLRKNNLTLEEYLIKGMK